MMPETPENPPEGPKRPRKAKSETAKAADAVRKVVINAEAEVKRRIGTRKSSYDPAIAMKMCELLAEGTPLREICRMEGMPPWRNIYFWMARDPDLAAHIARAREVGYDSIAEECLDIADNARNDWMERERYNPVTKKMETERVIDQEHIQRSKLRIETRLKLLAKWSNKYSDRTVITGDANGAPIKTEESGSGRLFELIKALEMRKRLNEA
mgnify:CR=1 FL=1